jgi:hypothetical protein
MVSSWVDRRINERGYVHDKWTPIPLEQRTAAVLKLADFLLREDPPVKLPTREDLDDAHVHRASCHGPIGELQCGFPAKVPPRPVLRAP